MSASRTYLDHNATSPLRPDARNAMCAAMALGGNASSVHAEGRAARKIIDDAREQVAAMVGATAPMVTFTSGGTEANNLAIRGAPVERFVVSAAEHKAVLEPARMDGRPVDTLPVDGDGRVDLIRLEIMLARDPRPAMVSVMLANNETGVIQPVSRVVDIAHAHGAIVHTDAVQAAGKIACNLPLLGADMLTLSAHKLGGPQGVGALIVPGDLPLAAQVIGGGQERGRRCGTENLVGIAGFGAACEAVVSQKPGEIRPLRDALEARALAAAPDTRVFGANVDRLPNTCCLASPGLTAELALMAFDLEGIAVSSGSACSSGKVARSHVLSAMGIDDDLAACAIRVSLGWNSTMEDVERFAAVWQRLVNRLPANAA